MQQMQLRQLIQPIELMELNGTHTIKRNIYNLTQIIHLRNTSISSESCINHKTQLNTTYATCWSVSLSLDIIVLFTLYTHLYND